MTGQFTSCRSTGERLAASGQKFTVELLKFMDNRRNHNPRVGGSSPSSATIFQALSETQAERFTPACKLVAALYVEKGA